MTFAFVSLIVGIIAAVAGIGTTLATNYTNMSNQAAANDANLRAFQETNRSNVEQANIAYERSLPINQVRTLMDAGMSRAGALNKLTGGGTYTAPVLQSGTSQAAQTDFSGISQAFDRLQSIPSNVEQNNLIQEQRNSLISETRIREADAARRAELHQYDLFERLHGRKVTEAVDNLTSKVINYAADNGISLDNIDSPEKMVSMLNLKNDKDWRDMPAAARRQMFDNIRTQAAENRASEAERRAREEQDNQNIAAMDNHLKSALERKEMRQRIEDFDAEKDARQKEYKARALRADIDALLAQDGLSLAEYKSSLEFDENGQPKFSRKVSEKAKRAWDRLADTIGIGVLKDLLSGLVAVR